MRKIETAMVAAIRAGCSVNLGNTNVEVLADHCIVSLHGNRIAVIGHPVKGTCWSLAGWNTPTTRSRINALAYAFKWRGVRNIKGVPHTPNGPVSETEWVNALA